MYLQAVLLGTRTSQSVLILVGCGLDLLDSSMCLGIWL